MTQGLARVEELLEARQPKLAAEISDLDGIISIEPKEKELIVTVTAEEIMEDEYYFDEFFDVAVKVGQEIKVKQILARSNKDKQKITSKFA
jgi:DNA-directed RNA polymerase subunit beta'